MCWLFGKRGSAKSFVALEMAAAVGTGSPWHGYPVKQAPVVYAALEGGSGMHQRAQAWEEHHGTTITGVHFLVPRLLHVIQDAGPLADLVAETGAKLLVIDTQNRATTGLEENSSIDMGRMIAHLDLICQRTGTCVLMVHHTSDGYRPRGHTSIDGAATSMIRVAKDGSLVKVSNEKQKDGPRLPALLLTTKDAAASLVLVPEQGTAAATDSEATIRNALANLNALHGPCTHADLKRACLSAQMPESTFNWALRRQVQRNGVTKQGAKYVLVTAGPIQPAPARAAKVQHDDTTPPPPAEPMSWTGSPEEDAKL